MWAELKMNHETTSRTRGEIATIATIGLAVVLIGVLLTAFAGLAKDQVRKAELRDSLLLSQRMALVRCSEESASAAAMRSCMNEIRLQTADAPNESYGLATQAASPTVAAGVSLVSLR